MQPKAWSKKGQKTAHIPIRPGKDADADKELQTACRLMPSSRITKRGVVVPGCSPPAHRQYPVPQRSFTLPSQHTTYLGLLAARLSQAVQALR